MLLLGNPLLSKHETKGHTNFKPGWKLLDTCPSISHTKFYLRKQKGDYREESHCATITLTIVSINHGIASHGYSSPGQILAFVT